MVMLEAPSPIQPATNEIVWQVVSLVALALVLIVLILVVSWIIRRAGFFLGYRIGRRSTPRHPTPSPPRP